MTALAIPDVRLFEPGGALPTMGRYAQFITYVVVPSVSRPGKSDKWPTNFQTRDVCDAHDPRNWADYASAIAAARASGHGVGFVFTDADPLWFLDVDDGRQADGKWSPVAEQLCEILAGCAVELSQSGNGLHIFGTGQLPQHGTRNSAYKLELYHARRFVALTGSHAVGTSDSQRLEQMAWICTTYFPPGSGADVDPDAELTTSCVDGWERPFHGTAEEFVALLAADDSKPISRGGAFGSAYTTAELVAFDSDELTNVDGMNQRSEERLGLFARMQWKCGNNETLIDQAAEHIPLCTKGGRIGLRRYEIRLTGASFRQKWAEKKAQRDEQAKASAAGIVPTAEDGSKPLEDFWAYLPTHTFMYVPTRELWPGTSVNQHVSEWPIGTKSKAIAPAQWLDGHRAVVQAIWNPNEPEIVVDRVMRESGWVKKSGAHVFNLYQAPSILPGDSAKAKRWLDHVHHIYPNEANHIIPWLAHRVQFPGVKVNHALVLGGGPGIGKDSIIEPVKIGIGPWNCQEIVPSKMLGNFNGWVKGVILRISEARDLGDIDRYAFYEHSKVIIAAPPDVIRCNEKHLREHYVVNVCGVVITTNHKTDGLYLPPDDRRHFVAWSEATNVEFADGFWKSLHDWYASEGAGHVTAYLRAFDLTKFDAKAPPPKTPAFWAMVQAGEAPESGELRDVLDRLGNPPAVTVATLTTTAALMSLTSLSVELSDRKLRRSIPHKLDRVGYVPVRNPSAEDGLFKVTDGPRRVVYARKQLSISDQILAARSVESV